MRGKTRVLRTYFEYNPNTHTVSWVVEEKMARTWLKGSKEGGQFGVFVKILSLANLLCSLASDRASEVWQHPWVFFSLPPFVILDIGWPFSMVLPYHPSPQTHEGQGKASLLFNCACACVCLCTYACVHVPIPERGHRQRRFFYSIFPHSSICVHYGLIHVKPSIASFQYQNVGEQPLNSLKVTRSYAYGWIVNPIKIWIKFICHTQWFLTVRFKLLNFL